MKLRINSLKEGSQTIEMTLTKSDLAISDKIFIKPILATLNIYKSPYQITIKAQLKTEVDLQCDRCLKTFQRSLDTSFQTILNPRGSGRDTSDENIIPIGMHTNEVDLSPFAHDALLTELPMKNLCSETCKGICPKCGADLNNGLCTCQTSEKDERWTPLKNLLTNIEEE
ncbi:MAG: hypothetical protein DRP96_01135 [Candidatus Neomarinimicrobiota bacterium]|nr:MAG: hypothetical protein DRP96_01135 [Candidatus Neomarinimicrobiota bacterium]